MTRIPPLEPPYPVDIQADFEQVMRGKPPLLLFRTIGRSGRAWRKFRSSSLLDRGPLTLRQREIVIDRTCFRAGCEYEWGVHVRIFAGAARLADAEIRALVQLPFDAEGWPENESTLVATVDALHERATLDDAEFARLRSHFNEDQVLEILMLAGFYRTVSYLANGLALPREPDTPEFRDYA
jgi:alkylhydroperoxidase family enzyme